MEKGDLRYPAPPPGFVPPPPYEANPPQYHPPHTVEQVIVVNATRSFGPESQAFTCPHCHATISTRVESEPNSRTHCIALLICLFLCWPCAWIPYCVDSCKSMKHYCPNCNAFLGAYEN